MKWSDSRVRVYRVKTGELHVCAACVRVLAWKEMEAGWTPKLESCRCSQKAIGFEMSRDMARGDTSSLSQARTSVWMMIGWKEGYTEARLCSASALHFLATFRPVMTTQTTHPNGPQTHSSHREINCLRHDAELELHRIYKASDVFHPTGSTSLSIG